jgi:hypothetical protein
METDAKKIASGGNWGYIESQPKGKTEIPAIMTLKSLQFAIHCSLEFTTLPLHD